jgi:hypothetical protein
MPPFSWSLRQLGLAWLVAVGASLLLLALGAFSRPAEWRFFWLLPYRGGLLGKLEVAVEFLRQFFAARPLEATALVAVPTLALLVTACWVIGRLLGR